jgi:metal-dependent amidase/aminoacylase/carboxypeptidase family protein
MISIVQALNLLPASLPEKDDAKMVTIIHLRLGEEAFGTSPGEGEIMATFRSYEDSNLAVMMQETERLVPEIANLFSLQYNLEWVEKFASTVNDDIACTFLTKAAEKLNLEIIRPVLPFRWTEDFSYFSQLYKTAFFGLGAGEKQPQLHNPDYDFPDSLIETGVKLFYEIIKEVSVYYAADKLD